MLSTDFLYSLELNRQDLAEGLVKALRMREYEELSRADLLNMSVPASEEEQAKWIKVLAQHQPKILKEDMDKQLERLDAIIGRTLGLSDEDIQFVQSECAEDPFLRGIKPRYPGTETRKQGFRTGLDSGDRYE